MVVSLIAEETTFVCYYDGSSALPVYAQPLEYQMRDSVSEIDDDEFLRAFFLHESFFGSS